MKEDLTLNISGMHCGGCVNRVVQALKKVPGVEVEDVQVGKAHVRYDKNEANPAVIEAVIQKIGYTVAGNQ